MWPLNPTVRVLVSVDWDNAEPGFDDEVLVELRSPVRDFDCIHVPLHARIVPTEDCGFVKSDGYVSIHATNIEPDETSDYEIIPYLGRTGDGAVSLRRDPHSSTESLRYPFYPFTDSATVVITLYFTFTLDTDPENSMTYEVGIDNNVKSEHPLVASPSITGELPPGWIETVMDCAWSPKHTVDVGGAGSNTLLIHLPKRNCLLEKLVIDAGGVKESYLGPPQSTHV